jgi:hypothetical protein
MKDKRLSLIGASQGQSIDECSYYVVERNIFGIYTYCGGRFWSITISSSFDIRNPLYLLPFILASVGLYKLFSLIFDEKVLIYPGLLKISIELETPSRTRRQCLRSYRRRRTVRRSDVGEAVWWNRDRTMQVAALFVHQHIRDWTQINHTPHDMRTSSRTVRYIFVFRQYNMQLSPDVMAMLECDETINLLLHLTHKSSSAIPIWTDRLEEAVQEWCHVSVLISRLTSRFLTTDDLVQAAGKYNRVDILRELPAVLLVYGTTDFLLTAARRGHLPVIIFIESLRTRTRLIDEHLHKQLLVKAVRGGQFHVIEWLLSKTEMTIREVYYQAVIHDRLNVLIWMRQRGGEWPKIDICNVACSLGRRDILDWLQLQPE